VFDTFQTVSAVVENLDLGVCSCKTVTTIHRAYTVENRTRTRRSRGFSVKRASSGLTIAALESMKKTLILCASPALISIEIVGCKQ